ncbi:MAG: hypothetical protein JW786_13135 [Desulfobacterales bacterium]|nr:hypothetical protein [Desulfobacterales bacterium]
MKIKNIINSNGAIIYIFCSIIFFNIGLSYAEEEKYPVRVEVVEKNQAKYDTPENTFAAICSALIKKDFEWANETLTEESAEEYKRLHEEAGIDSNKMFELGNGIIDTFIIAKKEHKDGILLVIKDYYKDGTIIKSPITFVVENGKWKQTNKFKDDEELWNYTDNFPPLFDGKGQRPADVNTFLAYANPTQIETELPVGTSKFSLHIFYGETIDPATFKAELNNQDISSQFDPKPVGDQTVELGLKKGRNVLTLSIEGEREDKKKSKDKDRLVFIVP